MSRTKFNEPFRGAPKFLRIQLQQDWYFVKRGMVAPTREREIRGHIDQLLKEFRHLQEVRPMLLRHFYLSLGYTRTRELAASNLAGFLFRKACQKALEIQP